jgi:iron(III) transport system substrate-binding protein
VRVIKGVVGVVAGALLLTACGSSEPAAPEPVTVTLYNAQHESLAQEWTADFTRRTGVRVEMRDLRIVSQLGLIAEVELRVGLRRL